MQMSITYISYYMKRKKIMLLNVVFCVFLPEGTLKFFPYASVVPKK